MKLRSLSVILLLQALPSLIFAASTDSSLNAVIRPGADGSVQFVASGVNTGNISSSDRFYDNGKGFYWQTWTLQSAALDLYEKTGNWSFLGDLSSRVPATANQTGEFYANLTDDANTCWYNAGSNVIQYWQTYYGVFYRGVGDNGTDSALPHGYTYDESHLAALAGTQSLQVDMLFYDNWENVGGNTEMSMYWYLTGYTSFDDLRNNPAKAGFFRDYFANTEPCVMEFEDGGLSMSAIRRILTDGLGLTENADGTFTQSTVGQIIDFGISSNVGGHAITCYGAEFDAAGNVTSVLIANSDDMVYGTERLYLKSENGRVYLYTDEACTRRWDYAAADDWYVDMIGYINTPDSLKRMYAQYTDAQNPLVWNGSSRSWDAAAANPDLLPTEATGWDVYVSEGSFTDYYHSWYDAARPLEFGDRGQGGEISVKGNIAAGAVSFNSDAYRYSLSGDGNNTVTAASLSITGKGGVVLRTLNFYASEASLSAGSLSLGSGAALTGGSLGVNGGASLVLDGGSLGSDSAYFSTGSLLSVSSAGGSFTGDLLTLGPGATLSMDLSGAADATSALLSVSGRLNLGGSVTLELGDQLEEGAVYRLMDFTNGTAPSNWESMFVGYTGTLEMQGNELLLINDGGVLYWKGGNGIWESTNWALSEDGTESLDFRPRSLVYFTGSTSQEAIEVGEPQQVRGLVFDGQYSLYSISGSTLDVLSSVELLENASVDLGLSANLAQASVTLASGSSLKIWSSATIRVLENDGSLVQLHGDLSITEAVSSPGAVDVQDGNLSLGARENSLGSLQVSGSLSAEGQLSLTSEGASSSIGSVSGNLSISAADGHQLTLGNDSSLSFVQGGNLSLGGSLALTESSAVESLNLGSDGALTLNNGAVISVSGELSGSGSVTISQPHGVEAPYLSAGSVSAGSVVDFCGLSGSSILDGLTSGQTLVLATVSGDNNGRFTFDGSTSASGSDGEYRYNLVNENGQVYILSHLNMVEWVGKSDDLWASGGSWSDGSASSTQAPDSETDLSFQGAGEAFVTLQQAQAHEVVVEYVAGDKPEGYTWKGGSLEADSLSIRSGSLTLAADASALVQSTQVSGEASLLVLGHLNAGKTEATAVTLGGSGHLTIADGSRLDIVDIDPQSGGTDTSLELTAGSASLGSALAGKLVLGSGASLSASELILTGSGTAAEGSITADAMGSVAIGNSFANVTTAELVFGELSEAQEAFHIDHLAALDGQQIDVTLLDPSSLGLTPGQDSVSTGLAEGAYRLMTWTSGSADFRLSEQAESYLAGLMLTGTLEASANGLTLTLDTLSGLTWYTSSDKIGNYTLQLSGEGAYNSLVPVSAVSVTRDNTLDLSSSEITTASAGTLGAVVRQMTGQSGRTLSFIGSGAKVDRVTFLNDERSTTGAHRIAGRNITLQVGGSEDDFRQLIEAKLLEESAAPGNHALTVGGVVLESSRLEVTDAPGVSFTTGTLDGDANSVIAGTIHINGAGGRFQGSADGLEGATIVLQSGADQSFSDGAGLVVTGAAGAASIAGDSLGALSTTGADITLSPLGSAATPQPVELGADSSMSGGTLAAKVDTAGVFRGEGETAALFSGASIALNGTRLVLNSGGSATPSTAAEVDLSKRDGFVIAQLHEQGLGSATGVSVGFGPGLLDKYFARATVQGNQIVASRNTSYYVSAAASTPNGSAGLALADGALVAFNPQAGTNSATHPDLAGVLNSLDAAIAAGDRAGADRLGAMFAGAEAAGMGMAFSNDMDRQLRAIRNRTTTMGVGDEYVNPEMPYFNAWINAEGDYQQVKRDGTTPGYTLSSWGGTLGADVDFTPHFTAGLAVTAMYGDYQSESNGMAEGDLDSYYVTLFGRYSGNSAWVHTFVASVGMADASLKRTVTHANGSYTAEGDTTGMGFGLLYELGYTIALNEEATTCLQPVLNLSYVHTTLDGYRESGSDAALNLGDQTMDSFTVGLGARLQTLVGENIYNRTSMFESRALLKFTTGDRSSSMHTALASLPSMKSRVESEEQGAIGVELGAGLSVPLGADSGTLFMDASLEAYTSYTNVNATVGWRINF